MSGVPWPSSFWRATVSWQNQKGNECRQQVTRVPLLPARAAVASISTAADPGWDRAKSLYDQTLYDESLKILAGPPKSGSVLVPRGRNDLSWVVKSGRNLEW